MRCNQFYKPIISLFAFGAIFFCSGKALGQQTNPKINLAKLTIDPMQLQAYKSALREEIDASIRLEPGVLSLYAVYEKDDPTHVTVFEIYADEEAYRSHIQTPHFKKYKETVTNMVKSLELVAMLPIALGSKPKLPEQ